ncbi:hypothetical protein PMI16_00178 [Herbaspirillum sp. CF444]|uniref:DUF6216 family protein n=1 Tax=Herbaspirillum sp. CF444 TaxID=1144319 RepID=UPI000272397E|nr:DUF6216 family protein [Herbaspirillum sp. CF444]EJL94407.1 hypothetical protein PMI16_00178 [Herbaspirillum sp. CF444]
MEFSSPVQVVQQVFSFFGITPAALWVIVYPTVLIGAIVLFGCFRTQSDHLLMARIWRLLQGKRPITDQAVNSYFADRDALMKFTFHTTLPMPTLANVHRIIQWADKREIPMREIRKCGHFFDLRKLEIRKEKIWRSYQQIIALLIGIVLGYGCIGLGILALAPNVLVQLKTGEQRWFFISEKGAVKTLTKDSRFTISDCAKNQNDISVKSGWNSEDIKTMCEILKDPSLDKDVADMLIGQRAASSVFAVLFLVLTYISITLFTRSIAARDMLKLLAQLDAEGAFMQLELDL